MKFSQHSYFKRKHRIPKPEVLKLESEQLILIAIPWGKRDHIAGYLEKISDFYLAAKEDNEATSPFPKFPQLSSNLNNLQVAIQLCNQSLLKEVNSDEYVAGIEIFACYLDKKELGWVSFGGPSAFIGKNSGEIRLINASSNWAQSYESQTPSLPKQFLGIHPFINLNINFMKWNEKDSLFLFYSNQISSLELKNSKEKHSLDSIVEHNFSSENHPYYWVAQIDF